MEDTGTIYPLIIINSGNNTILDVTYTNRKGYIKSLEQGELWHLHQTTGRLLPYQSDTLSSISQSVSDGENPHTFQNTRQDNYEAIDQGTLLSTLNFKGQWYEAYITIASKPIVKKTRETIMEKCSVDETPSQVTPEPATSNKTISTFLIILEELEKIIQQRKNELPEGSYTTHLFITGSNKIRKKIGEEAIELLLAQNKEEIIHETADLIYHMLVLLVDEEISLHHVLSELQHRFSPNRSS